jgi:hypothetical protein
MRRQNIAKSILGRIWFPALILALGILGLVRWYEIDIPILRSRFLWTPTEALVDKAWLEQHSGHAEYFLRIEYHFSAGGVAFRGGLVESAPPSGRQNPWNENTLRDAIVQAPARLCGEDLLRPKGPLAQCAATPAV